MAEKFKEQAVIISQERLLRRFTACGSKQIKSHSMQRQDSLFLFTVRMEADCSRVRSVSCEIDKEDCALHLVYRIAGAGTRIFPEADRRSSLCDGTAWKRFPVKEQKAFLIGGGIGIPPMLELAKQLNCEKQIILGYRNSDMFLLDEFKNRGSIYCHRGWQCGIKRKCPGCDPGE